MKIKYFLILVILLISSCSDDDSSDKNVFTEETQEKIKFIVDSIVAEKDIPGAIMAVWYGDKGSMIYTTGYSDLENETPMESGLKFRIGSVTKTFTASVVFQLVEEGKLSLDDKLNSFQLDNIEMDSIPYSNIITIDQLLKMTSGLYDYADSSQMYILATEPTRHWTESELIQYIYGKEPYALPGVMYHYTNTAYDLLGLIVEKITGNTIKEEIESRFISKLNLQNTSFPDPNDAYLLEPHAEGYYYFPEESRQINFTVQDVGWAGAAGAMISNINDLRIWVKALNDCSLISKEMTDKRYDWRTMDTDYAFYGGGLMKVLGFVGHSGGIPGFTNITMRNESADLTIIVMTNYYDIRPERIGGPEHTFMRIVETIAPELINK